MATGTVTVTITVPSLNGAGPNGDTAHVSALLASQFLHQAAQQIGATRATSGNITYPPGASAAVIGTWAYTPAT